VVVEEAAGAAVIVVVADLADSVVVAVVAVVLVEVGNFCISTIYSIISIIFFNEKFNRFTSALFMGN
jgi:hypothetical protein